MSLNIDLLKIPVSDIDRSVAFYEVALGLQAVFVNAEFGWAQFEGAAFPFALYIPGKGGGNRTPGGSVDFHFNDDQLDERLTDLQNSNIEAEIFSNQDGSRSLEFSDPDGNHIKIMERP